jgi:peptide/nickel transport system substrate-binding protein
MPSTMRPLYLAAASAALLAGCGQSSPELEGSVLRARLNADIVSSDPGMKRDANTDAVILHVVEGLVAASDDGTVIPMLASRWDISADGLTYRFHLRPGVRFHNDAPLTAAEVVWSLNRYLAADSRWRCKADLSHGGVAPVVSVRADGRDIVEIKLAHAAPLFLTELARVDCGGTGITHRDSLDADGNWRHPIGTGPFRWGKWQHREYIDLLRYEGYRPLSGPPNGTGGGKRVLVDRVRFSIIPDGSAAAAALLRGSLDVLDALAPNELANVSHAPGIHLASGPSLDFYGILFQVRDPAMADPRLRRAIAHSIDVDALTRVVTHDTGTPNSSPVPTASAFFGMAQRPLIKRDLAKARALAKAAGYRGQPIQLATSHAPPEMYDAAILVQAMARDAGINIEVVTLDWASQLARYTGGNYQAMVFGFSARLDPSLSFGVLVGDKAKEPRKTWDTPVANALLRQSITTGDRGARQEIFDQMERHFRADAPAIILYNTRRVTALRDRVTGYRNWPGQTQRLWNVGLEKR